MAILASGLTLSMLCVIEVLTNTPSCGSCHKYTSTKDRWIYLIGCNYHLLRSVVSTVLRLSCISRSPMMFRIMVRGFLMNCERNLAENIYLLFDWYVQIHFFILDKSNMANDVPEWAWRFLMLEFSWRRCGSVDCGVHIVLRIPRTKLLLFSLYFVTLSAAKVPKVPKHHCCKV
jgi:hypothetical protein